MKVAIMGFVVAALGATVSAQALTDLDVWPANVNGKKVWPADLPKGWKAPDAFPPQEGPVPPDDLFSRIKCPDGSKKLKVATPYSTRWEHGYWHPPVYAVDEYVVSRWSSWEKDWKWFVADMGKTVKVTRLVLVWESAFATGYDIKFATEDVVITPPSADPKVGTDTAKIDLFNTTLWKTAKQVTASDGKADVVDVEGDARFIQMFVTKKVGNYGYSLFEFSVCGQDDATSIAEQKKTEARKRWGLMLGADGIPQGVKAFDISGKALQSSDRKIPYSNIYVAPKSK